MPGERLLPGIVGVIGLSLLHSGLVLGVDLFERSRRCGRCNAVGVVLRRAEALHGVDLPLYRPSMCRIELPLHLRQQRVGTVGIAAVEPRLDRGAEEAELGVGFVAALNLLLTDRALREMEEPVPLRASGQEGGPAAGPGAR